MTDGAIRAAAAVVMFASLNVAFGWLEGGWHTIGLSIAFAAGILFWDWLLDARGRKDRGSTDHWGGTP